MTEQITPAPDDNGPAVHFTETLVSAVDRHQNITVGTSNDSWFSGIPVVVSHGVLVIDNDHKRTRMHLRIADIHTMREYLPDGEQP